MVELVTKYQRYAEYKDSGVEWLGEIPSHWAMNKLRYLFAFSKGLTITKENLVDEGIPCVNYGEVHSKYGFQVDPLKHILKCVEEKYLKSSPNSLLKKGDFIFADTSEDLKGSGNFTHLVNNEKVFAGYHTVIGRPQDATVSRFYAYLFDSQEFRSQIQLAVKGVKVFSITQAMLRASNIWLPSQDEKKKIANFLDHETAKIDSLIEKQKQLIQLLKEKRQAVISHAVTKGLDPSVKMKDSGVEWLGEVPEHWIVTRLKYAKSESQNAFVDGPFGSNLKSVHFIESGDVYVIESNFATTGKLDTTELKKITNKHFETISRSEAKGGDIIIAKIGARFGSNAILPNIDKKAVVSGNSLKLKMNNSICEVNYAHMLLKHLKIEGAMDDGVNGSAQPALSLGGLNNLPFLLPPLGEQLKITSHLELTSTKFGNLINKAESAIQLMQERRTALISAAVTGKIDVRNWKNPNNTKMELSA